MSIAVAHARERARMKRLRCGLVAPQKLEQRTEERRALPRRPLRERIEQRGKLRFVETFVDEQLKAKKIAHGG